MKYKNLIIVLIVAFICLLSSCTGYVNSTDVYNGAWGENTFIVLAVVAAIGVGALLQEMPTIAIICGIILLAA